jgi:hypothetical protein
VDNVVPHRSKVTSDDLKEFNFRLLPHPPFSTGLAQSDFYLFGVIKGTLAGSEFGSAEELVSELVDVTSFMSHVILAIIFCELEQRLQKCINTEGNYAY